MAGTSLEDLLQKQLSKLDDLHTATIFVGHRVTLKEELAQAKKEVSIIVGGIRGMKSDLEIMRTELEKAKNMLALVAKLNTRILRIEANVPADFLCEFTRLNHESSPFVQNSNKKQRIKGLDESILVTQVENLNLDTPEPRMEDCKKTLFKNAEDSYNMELLSIEEFSKIPKYIIGRQSMAALNDFVTVINQILEGKYSLLAMGKNGARKKGKLDLYLSFKRDEILVSPGKDPIYYFTAEDYNRHTQSKLDKTKLNLLTALRHCKRVRELRKGKTLQYVLVPSWEGNRGGMCG